MRKPPRQLTCRVSKEFPRSRFGLIGYIKTKNALHRQTPKNHVTRRPLELRAPTNGCLQSCHRCTNPEGTSRTYGKTEKAHAAQNRSGELCAVRHFPRNLEMQTGDD